MKKALDRRDFLKLGAMACATCPLAAANALAGTSEEKDESRFVKEAMFYKKLDDRRIRCTLCPRQCEIADRERGMCGVRENREGTYYTLVHSRPCSGPRPDPIPTHLVAGETGPVYHQHLHPPLGKPAGGRGPCRTSPYHAHINTLSIHFDTPGEQNSRSLPNKASRACP